MGNLLITCTWEWVGLRVKHTFSKGTCDSSILEDKGAFWEECERVWISKG